MTEDCFRFKSFNLIQSDDVFRMCSDSLLLGLLSRISPGSSFVEIGSGTGIVSLLLMQRGMKQGLALDIHAPAANLSELNFKESPWNCMLLAQHGDFLKTEPLYQADALFCNPPYFKKSLKPDKKYLHVARHRDAFHPAVFFSQAIKWMKEEACLHLIIPASDRREWLREASLQGLFPVHETDICPVEESAPTRSLLEFKKKPEPTGSRQFVLRKRDTRLTGEYKSLLESVFLQEPV